MTSRSKHETSRQRWERQWLHLSVLRANLARDHAGQGQKWVESMRRYYDRRLADLKAAEPPREVSD